MKNPMYNIDDLFYKGLREHSENPSENTWNNIEAELDKDVAAAYKRKYKIVKRNALILFAMVLGFVLYEAINLYYKKEPGVVKLQAKTNTGHQQPADHSIAETPSVQNTPGIKQRNKKDNRDYETSITDLIHNVYVNGADVNKTSNKLIGEDLLKTNNLNAINDNDKEDDATDIKRHSIYASMTADESWKKNLKANQEPMAFSFASPLKTPIAVKEINKPGTIKESRFFISAYFSGAGSWNSISTNDYNRHLRRGGNNNVSNGGNGNNGGSNNGGGTPSNSGGTPSGNNNGGNNGTNNGGSNGTNTGSGGSGGGNDRRDIKQNESGNIAWSGGMKLSYNLNKKLSVETGLNYLLSSISVKPKMIYAEKDDHGNVGYRLNCSSGYSYLLPKGTTSPGTGDSTIASDTRSTVSYIGVPVIVQYRILSAGRFDLRGSAGGQFNFLLKGSTSSVLGKGTASDNSVSSNTEGLRSNYFSALVNLDAELRLNKNLSFTLSPFSQFGLTNINKKSVVQTRPNYIGAAVGLKLKL